MNIITLWFWFVDSWYWIFMQKHAKHLYIFFEETPAQTLCASFKLVHVKSFCYWVVGVSYMFFLLTLYETHGLYRSFLLFYRFLFSFLHYVLCCTELFSFIKCSLLIFFTFFNLWFWYHMDASFLRPVVRFCHLFF